MLQIEHSGKHTEVHGVIQFYLRSFHWSYWTTGLRFAGQTLSIIPFLDQILQPRRKRLLRFGFIAIGALDIWNRNGISDLHMEAVNISSLIVSYDMIRDIRMEMEPALLRNLLRIGECFLKVMNEALDASIHC
jgi:hypothetical protein